MGASNHRGEIVVALLVALGGAWVFGLEVYHWRLAMAARRWAVTQGVVEWTNGGCSGRLRYGTRRSCNIRGRYSYLVQGKQYVGRRFTLNDVVVGPPETLDSLMRRFWQGNHVIVYYDPADPSSAVLDRTDQFNRWNALWGGVLIAIVVGASVRRLFQWRQERAFRSVAHR